MKQTSFLVILCCFFSIYCSGQFNYIAADAQNVAGTYTDLGNSGTPITHNFAGDTMTFDDDNSSVQEIGFGFSYNGTAFTQFVLNTNGFIKLGSEPGAANAYDVISSGETNVIAPFNYDLNAATDGAEYRVFTSGLIGSRICTIQFKNLKEWFEPQQYDSINFQIKLFETSNTIEFVYGNFAASTVAPSLIKATTCIKGNISPFCSVKVNKSGSTDWSAVLFVNGNSDTRKLENKNNRLPVPGQTFRFVSAPLNDAEVITVYALSKLPIPSGSSQVVSARITNRGTMTMSNIAINLTVSGANTFTDLKVISLAPGDTMLVSFNAFSSTVIGPNTIAVSISNSDDIIENNISYFLQSVNTNTYSYADNNSSSGAIGFGIQGGSLLVKYKIAGTATVNAVRINMNQAADTGNIIYAIVMDAAGTIIAQSDPYTTDPADFNTYKNFTLTAPTTLSNTDFYVGIVQTPNTTEEYYPLSTQTESAPTRLNAYYYSGIGNGLPLPVNNLNRFMIQAVLAITDPISSSPYINSNWKWVNGNNTPDGFAVFGSLGNAAPENTPGARNRSVSWTDSLGNFWLFGGIPVGFDATAINDLWKYNPQINQWTWVSGDNLPDQKSIYGIKGEAASSNKPGAREGSISWTDNSGNLWLFGGFGYGNSDAGYLNDLWKYNVSSNQWTWVKGDSSSTANGFYGVQGNVSPENNPPGRIGGLAWVDSSGSFWLFGGIHNVLSEFGDKNDLWKYDPVNNNWTWMKGDSNSARANYGTLGIPSISNKPGGRYAASSWKDHAGNLWLFGGSGSGTSNYGELNDLWSYNVSTGFWTWVSGDSILYSSGIYGTQGAASATNKPGPRNGSFFWTDPAGNFWLYGGQNILGEGNFSDLWKYEPSTNEWTWVNGSSSVEESPVYGTQGIESGGNTPGARQMGVSWSDNSGHLWLYGGFLNNTGENYNDLWTIYGGPTYIFTGDGDWLIPENWINNLVGPTDIPGATSVIIDNYPPGQCDENGNINIQAAGKLTVNPSKKLNIINGDLTNAGNLNGTGTVTFAGAPTALSSSGSISAPLILINKELYLNGNANTGSIELSEISHIRLDSFYLNMGTGNLTGDADNFIITNDTGRIIRNVGTTPVSFYVGVSDASYTPITLTNSGTVGNFKVRVAPGVNTFSKIPSGIENVVQTTGYVNRTWFVDSTDAGSHLTVEVQWNSENEQPLFDRSNSYISQNHSCPLPPNCDDSYYDVIARTPASGNDPYTQIRNDVIAPTSFIVKSGADTSIFIGNGNWNNPDNWRIGLVPSQTIGMGKVIIINHLTGGECFSNEDINVMPGGALIIMDDKILRVPNLIIH